MGHLDTVFRRSTINNPAASRGVSKPKTTAKVCAPRGGELDPERLKSLFSARVRQDKPARDAAMRRACLEYGYTMAAVARVAGIHYSTVSKVIKGER